MCAKWNSNYDPHLLAERIESNCKRDANGQVSFGMEHHEYEAVLRSSLALSEEIRESEIGGIVWKGIVAAAKAGKITADLLRTEINRAERDFLKLPLTRFVVVTNLSLPAATSLTRRPRKDEIISIGGLSYGKFDRAQVMERAQTFLAADLPTTYSSTRVSLTARTTGEAGIKALEDLDLLRGIWNFRINNGRFRMPFGGKRKPVNQIFVGPIHTIHKPNGSLASPQFFYEPAFDGAVNAPDSQTFKTALDFEKRTFQKLNKSNYPELIAKAIRRYGRALDDTDFNAVFLKLWSILELLTQTAKETYDLTIKRSSCIYADRAFHKLLLEHLRSHRNQFVHLGTDSSQIETLVYQLKRPVEDLLLFHLNTYKWSGSLEEAIHFLDLPSEKIQITARLRELQFAMKFHGYK